jgi:hypothetical protein
MTSDFPLRLATPEIAAFEVVDASRMDGPEVAFAVGRASGLDEAVVEGEVVPDGVSPAGAAMPEVWKVVEDVLTSKLWNVFFLIVATATQNKLERFEI